jgi:hypothetical protein
VTKQEIIDAAEEIRTLLWSARNIEGESARRLSELDKEFGHIPAIKALYSEKYDAVAVNSGFGAPDCTCFNNPPCQACIDWTNYCDERQDAVEINKEPGCMIIDHDCEVVRNPA